MPGVSLSFIKNSTSTGLLIPVCFEKILLYRSLHPRRCAPGGGHTYRCPSSAEHTAARRSASVSASASSHRPECNPHSSRSRSLSATGSRKGYGNLHNGSLTPFLAWLSLRTHRVRPCRRADNTHKNPSCPSAAQTFRNSAIRYFHPQSSEAPMPSHRYPHVATHSHGTPYRPADGSQPCHVPLQSLVPRSCPSAATRVLHPSSGIPSPAGSARAVAALHRHTHLQRAFQPWSFHLLRGTDTPLSSSASAHSISISCSSRSAIHYPSLLVVSFACGLPHFEPRQPPLLPLQAACALPTLRAGFPSQTRRRAANRPPA